MLILENHLILMDKETLIKFAQPAATFALAISIISLPLIVKASNSMSIRGTYSGAPLRVYHENSCS